MIPAPILVRTLVLTLMLMLTTMLMLTIYVQTSLSKAKEWIAELHRQADPNIVIALAGNKADLAADTRAVPSEEAEAYAAQEGLLFIETSAKSGNNVTELFRLIAEKLPRTSTSSARPAAARPGVDLRGGAESQDSCNC